MPKDHVGQNARAIESFLIRYDLIHRSAAGSESPPGRSRRLEESGVGRHGLGRREGAFVARTARIVQPSRQGGNLNEKRIARNAEVLEGMILDGELSLKGTAPSFLNLESDRDAPGPSVLLSERGLDSLDAYADAREKAASEGGENPAAVSFYASHGRDHVRRDFFPGWYAMLRAQNDPGVVQRGKDPRASENDRVVRGLFQKACLKACEKIEEDYPGARLWRPAKPDPRETDEADVPVDAPKAGSWKRGDVLQKKRWTWEDSARSVGRLIEDTMKEEGCGIGAAKGLLADRKGFGVRELDRKWDFYRDEQAQREETA